MKIKLKSEKWVSDGYGGGNGHNVFSLVRFDERKNNFLQSLLGYKETVLIYYGKIRPSNQEVSNQIKKYKREFVLNNILEK